MVDSEGRNSIIIVPGANDRLSTADVEKARAAIAGCRILVTQLEVWMFSFVAPLRCHHTHFHSCIHVYYCSAHLLTAARQVPVETTLAALKLGRQLGLTTIFNPAPGLAELPAEIFTVSDFVCPNETEAEILTGQKVGSIPEAEVLTPAFLTFSSSL
jgi:ribokinase